MPGAAEERTRLALDEAILPSFSCSITQEPMHKTEDLKVTGSISVS